MENVSERALLLSSRHHTSSNGLSLTLAIICIIDVFGVFPIIALPKAIINCGYYGILVVFVVCSVQMYTASLLGRCWLIAQKIDPDITHKYRYPYSALAEFTYGKTLSTFATFLLDVTIFGAGIPNLIVASQNLQLLGMRLTENNFNLSFCYWILLMGIMLCPVLWLGSPKDMKLLCSLSVALVVSVFALVWCIIVFDPQVTPNDTQPVAPTVVPLWNSILAAYGILAFQFDIHPTILTIQVDMKEKSKITRAVLAGFGFSLAMFSLTTITTSWRYGNATRASLLETLPTSVFLHFAALLVALQLGLSSAVGNSALYQHMEDCMGIAREFNHKRCLLRTSLTIIAIVLAESVPRFDLVMSLIGGTLTGPLVFIFPPLFYIKIQQLQRKHEKRFQLDNLQTFIRDPSEVVDEFREGNYDGSGFYDKKDAYNKNNSYDRKYAFDTEDYNDVNDSYDRKDLYDRKSSYASIASHSRISSYSNVERNASYTKNRKTSPDDVVKNNTCMSNSKWFACMEICFCLIIIIIGAGTSLSTTYINVRNTIEFASFSPPCIMNLTSATMFVGS